MQGASTGRRDSGSSGTTAITGFDACCGGSCTRKVIGITKILGLVAKFHADRKAANAAAEMSNQAEEKAAAEALANETNAWNTVYGMVDGQLATYAGASPSHHDLLKSLGQKGK